MQPRTHIVIVAALALSGCLAQSNIQARYNTEQSECRDDAEANIMKYDATAANEKDRNAQLVTLFSDCMAKKGWQVAKPRRRPTTDGPHGPLDPYPSTAATAAAARQPQGQPQQSTQSPISQRPVQTTTTPLSPSGGMPPLSQPESPAHYQPYNSYTNGAGRNF